MGERNEFLESGGLVHESDTHEWFADKTSTKYAHAPNQSGIALKNLMCYVVRDKSDGSYDRVIVDNEIAQVIYSTKELELIGVQIDKLKLVKHFKDEERV